MAMNRQRKTSNLLNILNYDDAGNIVLRDYSQTIRYNWNGTIHAFTGPLSISSIAVAVTDTDRFLVSDGGVLKYRTGTEVLSDIGGVPSTRTLTINGTTQDLSANRTFTVSGMAIGSAITSSIPGSILFVGTSGELQQNNSNLFFWDRTNGRLGIGTDTPTKYLDVKLPTGVSTLNNGIAITRGSGTGLFLIGNGTSNINDFIPSIYSKSSVDNAGFYFGASVFSGTSTFPAMEFQAQNATQTGAIENSQTVARWANWATQLMQIRGNGNLLLQNGGTFTDGGQRLQVMGDAFIKGSGATSGTSALVIQNSSSNNIFNFRNDGTLLMSTVSGQTIPVINIVGRTSPINAATYIRVLRYGNSDSINQSAEIFGYWDDSNVTGFRFQNGLGTGGGVTFNFIPNGNVVTSNVVTVNQTFNPTSGTATIAQLLVSPTINQTGGANGITRGLYVNPTLTAAADWRSIEWSNNSGWGLYGAGTANNYLGGSLGIGTTSPQDKLHLGANVNQAIKVNSATANAAYFGIINDIGVFSANRNGVTGAIQDSTKASSAVYVYAQAGNGFITFETTATNNSNSIERMRITNAGRVCINDTGGLTLFNINTKSSSAYSATGFNGNESGIRMTNGSGGTGRFSGITFTGGGNTEGFFGVVQNASSLAEFVFQTYNGSAYGERMRITSGGSIGIGTQTPTASAILQIDSTTQGFLPPRMTTTQKNAIGTPAAGLQVYDSTTNTPNYYNGTAWVALGGGGTSIYTSDGTLTSDRTVSSGGFSLVFNPQTAFVTSLSAAPNDSTTALVSQNTLSYASGFSSTNIGSVYGAVAGINLQTFAGSSTFETANLATAVASVNSIDFSSTGSTITMTQPVGGGIRAMTGHQSQIQYQGTNSGTITHAAISQNLGFYRPSAATGTLTITNAYSLLINDLNDYGTGFTFTNRWAIYQDGASDNNYFKGKVVIGSTNTVGVSRLNVKDLPTSASGLATGDVWNNGGVLNIV